ncbi:MAG: site-2 protease family protein [Thermoguttaceae bacterium]|nr:site-2 protease family protein [Thermoguttaceae bacterium]MDW8039678.1 site-2 protease family protein [Thermoguttaceae bacterium]
MRFSKEPFFDKRNPPAELEQPIFIAELLPEDRLPDQRSTGGISAKQWIVAGLLFGATCLTTFLAGLSMAPESGLVLEHWLKKQVVPTELLRQMLWSAGSYALAVMIILTLHEAGHYLQARRYGVRVSLPYFIPMPLTPIGTLGAVIAMDARVPNRKVLFDIGVTGPLAGLIPTFICCVWGMQQARYALPGQDAMIFGDPLLFHWLAAWLLGPRPEGHEILLNPILFAGWVGLLITSLNLLPVGQLDGGHILYALVGSKARAVAWTVLLGVTALVFYTLIRYHNPGWSLMVILLYLIGPGHPPTYQDNLPIGPFRTVLGWLMLAFVVIGLTPMPVIQ